MSSPMSELSDDPPDPAPRRRNAAPDDDDDNLSSPPENPPEKPATKPLDDMFTDDDDEEVAPKRRRQKTPDGGEDGAKEASDLDADLFGEDSDKEMEDIVDDAPSRKVRTLDDAELDSGDDIDADPSKRRGGDYDESEEEERDETSYEVDIGLHQLPRSSNGETYILKVPQFISIAPTHFKPETFQAPKLPPNASVTPYNFATTAIRWRNSPIDPSQMQSNSRIIRWSDGTMSLQIGSAKDGLYDLPTNNLLPDKHEQYNASQDSFNFLAEPLANSRLVRFFSHATKSMAVVPASDNVIGDDIKHLLAARYQASQKRGINADPKRTVEISYKMEDPEKARREAEAQEKEVEKYNKRMEAQKRKQQDANGYGRRRTYGRRDGEDGGLTLDDLEEEEGGASQRSRAKGPTKRRPAGGPSYRGRQEEDDYEVDDFVERDPDSDEEEEEDESEEEEEEEEDDRRRRRKEKSKSKSSKRRAREEAEDEDEEPEAEFTDAESEKEASSRAAKPSPKEKPRPASDDEDADAEPNKGPERKRRRLAIDDSDEE